MVEYQAVRLHIGTMNTISTEEQRVPNDVRKRLQGLALIGAVYGSAALVLKVCWPVLRESLLYVIVGPPLLGVVWLTSGVILGRMVLSRTTGIRPYGAGLAYSAFLLAMVLGIFLVLYARYLNTHITTYHGP